MSFDLYRSHCYMLCPKENVGPWKKEFCLICVFSIEILFFLFLFDERKREIRRTNLGGLDDANILEQLNEHP